MSAIFGVIGANQYLLDKEAFIRMANALAHRGKDGSRTFTFNNMGFGHHMLFTTAESHKEKLPCKNMSGSLIITSDSRLDNRNELIDLLIHSTPIPAKELCDSHLLLLAYEKWGQKCVEHIMGDFVFAIWDYINQELFCARDHIGIRPLYYHLDDGNLIFSSELLSIFAFTNKLPNLNMLEIVDYLTFNKEETSSTIYTNVFRLPPASTLFYKDRQLTIKRYWQLEHRSPLLFASSNGYHEALRELIEKAIDCRIRTDYPCGVMLSGGLDSSALTVISHRKLQERNKPLYSYSYALPANHPGPETDEREYIKLLSDQNGLDASFILASGKRPFDRLTDYFQILGRPLNDLYYFVQEDIYDKARSHGVRILLTGIGGDLAASFNDKGYLPLLAKQRRWEELLQLTKKQSIIDNSTYFQTVRRKIISPLIAAPYNFAKGILTNNPLYHHTVNPDLFKNLEVAKRLQHYKRYSHNFGMPLNAHDAIRMVVNSGHFPTYQEDRSTTAQYFDIETCHPYFDIRILEFCMQVPLEQFTLNGWQRSLFRRAMQNFLPSEIVLRRDKKPFIPDFIKRLHNSRKYFNHTQKLEKDIWNILCKKTFSRCHDNFLMNAPLRIPPGVIAVLGFGSVMANFLSWYNQQKNIPTSTNLIKDLPKRI